MKNYDIEKQINTVNDFLISDEKVLFISSKFGNGKTYLINYIIARAKDDNIIKINTYSSYFYKDYIGYIYNEIYKCSINMKSKIVPILVLISLIIMYFLQSMVKITILDMSDMKKNITLFSFLIGLYKFVNIKLDSVQQTEKIKKALKKKNYIIVLDDVDRGIKDCDNKLFHVLDFLEDMDNCRLIILGNLDKIEKSNEESNIFIEKYIGQLYILPPNVKEELILEITDKCIEILEKHDHSEVDTIIFRKMIIPFMEKYGTIRSLRKMLYSMNNIPLDINVGEYVMLSFMSNAFPKGYHELYHGIRNLRSMKIEDYELEEKELIKKRISALGHMFDNEIDIIYLEILYKYLIQGDFNSKERHKFTRFVNNPNLYLIIGKTKNEQVTLDVLINDLKLKTNEQISFASNYEDIIRYIENVRLELLKDMDEIIYYHIKIIKDKILDNFSWDNVGPDIDILLLLTGWVENDDPYELKSNMEKIDCDNLMKYFIYKIVLLRKRNKKKIIEDPLFYSEILENKDSYNNPIIIEFLFEEKLSDEEAFNNSIEKIPDSTWENYFMWYDESGGKVSGNIAINPYNDSRTRIFIDKFADYIISNGFVTLCSKPNTYYDIRTMRKEDLMKLLFEINNLN